VSAAKKAADAEPITQPSPQARVRCSEVDLQGNTRIRVGAGTEQTSYLSATKGFALEIGRHPVLGELVLFVKHQSGRETMVPMTNVAAWAEWREASLAEKAASLPQEMAPIRAEQARQAAAAAAPDAPPKDIRPTVRAADLGPQAMQYYGEHGHVLIGGREHRVV